MFQLNHEDWENLKCQIGISSAPTMSNKKKNGLIQSQILSAGTHGGRRAPPYAFTEQGVAMLSSVLRSPRAVEVNIAIMRTFVQLRRLMDSNRNLALKIEAMEMKYDEQFAIVFDAIKQLIADDQDSKTNPLAEPEAVDRVVRQGQGDGQRAHQAHLRGWRVG